MTEEAAAQHEPLQVPTETYAQFADVTDDFVAQGLHHRRIYASMVSYMDGAVGDIVALLRRKDEMFAKTLLVFQSDNVRTCHLLHTLCCACSLTHR